MPHKILITNQAQQDTIKAIGYYTSISETLADRFEKGLYQTYLKVVANPQYYKYLTTKKNKKYRCAAIKAFPYIVIYRINEDTVVIMAVFHTRLKPVHGLP